MSNRNYRRGFWLSLPLAAVLLAATANQAAAQTEPSGMQKLLGAMGLIELPKDPIDYRERAPLVVPPSAGLIPPRSSDDIRQYNPDWPTDHTNNRPRTAKEIEAERKSDDTFYSGDRLGVIELQRSRISRDQAARRGVRANEDAPENEPLGPIGLGFKGWGSKKEEKVGFTGEPERRTLTEPPPGLRTPSFDAPFGVISNRPSPNKRTLFDRSASSDDVDAHR